MGMHRKWRQPILFVGGKGGVGKSTSTSAIGCMLADRGYRTLIVSTDPAHNLGHLFHRKMTGKPTKLKENLYGLEIDPKEEVSHYLSSVKQNLKGLVHSHMVQEVHRQIDLAGASPGSEESALFDRIVNIILEEKNQYEYLLFDTAPTGHTIRLLSLPELMGVWMDQMIKKREKINNSYTELLNDGQAVDDPIYDVLQRRRVKFQQVREILLDSSKTGFVFVMNPERLPIMETKHAIQQLEQFDLPVEHLIVNKILPDGADGNFLLKRKEQEKKYLQEIERTFKEKQLLYVPLLSQDVASMDQLQEVSTFLQ
nr:ArsA family ATPase [Pontibacillus halophilus]